MTLNSISHYAECYLCPILLKLSITNKPTMLSAIMLGVVLLSVMAPFLKFSLIVEGTTEKIAQFILPLKSIYNYNLYSNQQKMYF